jgi:hypothetical protein
VGGGSGKGCGIEVLFFANVSFLPREGEVQGIRERCWVCGSEILVIKKASCGGQIIGCFRHTHGGGGGRGIDDLPMMRAVGDRLSLVVLAW